MSDALVKHFGNNHDSNVYSQATGMQYSLYITVIVAALGGGTFLISTLTVIDDRKVHNLMITLKIRKKSNFDRNQFKLSTQHKNMYMHQETL